MAPLIYYSPKYHYYLGWDHLVLVGHRNDLNLRLPRTNLNNTSPRNCTLVWHYSASNIIGKANHSALCDASHLLFHFNKKRVTSKFHACYEYMNIFLLPYLKSALFLFLSAPKKVKKKEVMRCVSLFR